VRTDPVHGLRRSCGFVLIEVIAAVVLLGVLVAPLVTAMHSAVGRAAAVRALADESFQGSVSTGTEGAWQWGPKVVSVSWRSRPALFLEIQTHGGTAQTVGLWLDGWFLGEWDAAGDGGVQLKAADLHAVNGQELVARTRESGGAWGPPWRSIVPDAGEAPPSPKARPEAVVGDGAITGEESVGHVPVLANPPAGVSPADALLEKDPLGLQFILPASVGGRYDLSVDGLLQSWYAEAGRALDVYF
jgi:hypothetical protein